MHYINIAVIGVSNVDAQIGVGTMQFGDQAPTIHNRFVCSHEVLRDIAAAFANAVKKLDKAAATQRDQGAASTPNQRKPSKKK